MPTNSIDDLLKGLPDGKVMDQFATYVGEFVQFIVPLTAPDTFTAASMAGGFKLDGFKTWIAKIQSLPTELRSRIANACEDILKKRHYGLHSADDNGFIDTSDLFEGKVGTPKDIFLGYHNYPSIEE